MQDDDRHEATDTLDPLIGAIIDGRYRVDHVVGAGGFGKVYAAFHVGLGARVAIKVPRTDDLAPSVVPDTIAMFLEEGRTLKRLRHPNLAGALDVGLLPPDAQGTALPYLVIEWFEGPTLRDWLRENPQPLDRHEAWSLIRPVFEAIAYAHAEGIAHRDIKPANIILERKSDGRLVPRVIDLGIAKVLGNMDRSQPEATYTTSPRRAFTHKYAAPEQITGLRTGPWTDVYTLALLLLELLAGRAVFLSAQHARNAMVPAVSPTPA
jgi:eukaryotic-like serine/threonine-protein kinase